MIDGTLTFQPLGHGLAFFNGDLPLKPEQANPFIDALIATRLVFQAFHQHYIEMSPQVWLIHWRGVGDAIKLARAVHNVLKATSTPLPQTKPSSPPRRWTRVAWRRSSTGAPRAAVGPDFSMTGSELQPVISIMRKQGWFVGCLYNHETQEHPQLFFSHMLKTGDAYTLAYEIRRGLDRPTPTDSDHTCDRQACVPRHADGTGAP